MPGQNNDKDYQLINRFFEGGLSAEEEKSVDERIQTDPSFAEAMANYITLHRAAAGIRRDELESLHPEPPSGSGLSRRWWLWGGLGLLVIMMLYFLLRPPQKPAAGQPVALLTGEATLDYTGQRDNEFFKEMGGGERWKDDYLEGNYATARQKLNALLDAADNLDNLSRFCYYAGLLNLYPQEKPADLNRAITYLEIAQAEKQDASLYLLIAYVQANEMEKAAALAAMLPTKQVQRLPKDIREKL